MAAIYRTQNQATLITIANDLVTSMTQNNPIFDIFPIVERRATRLRWRIKDNYRGLMKLRGAGGEPTRVNPVGEKVYEERPGVFGEFSTLDEIDLMDLARGIPKDFSIDVDVKSEIGDRLKQLMERQMNRIRQMAWAGALTGNVQIPLPGGGIGYSMQYTPLTYAPTVLWSNPATSTPLKDLQGLQVAFGRGTSNNYGGMAQVYGNSKTLQFMFNNTNVNDFGGVKGTGGGTLYGMSGYESMRLGRGIGALNIWDEGYLDDSGAFQLDIPDGKLLIVGARPNGEKAGEISMTYNAVSDAPGAYAQVHDFTQGDRKSIPPRIEVHAGFNGGQIIERPTMLLVATVA